MSHPSSLSSVADEVTILPFRPEHRDDFRRLNHEWITRYFVLEENDHLVLDHPEANILATGGHIRMAQYQGEVVGTGALLKIDEQTYELAKMAVTDRVRGLGIGYRLAQAMLDLARELGARKVELVTNDTLLPAIALYQKLGFALVDLGAAKGYYQRGNVKMERWLEGFDQRK